MFARVTTGPSGALWANRVAIILSDQFFPRLQFLSSLAIGICVAAMTAAQATVVSEIGLDEMVSQAELIVEGTVVDVDSRWSESQTTIFTYVTLSDLRVVHVGDGLHVRGRVDYLLERGFAFASGHQLADR